MKMYFAAVLVVFAFSCRAAETPRPPSASAPQESPAPPAPPEERLEEIRADLENVKADLFEAGKYNCCVEPACHWCALHEGECPCFANLQAGEEVCPGCGLGWHNGQGIVEGIEASQVKWNITHEHGAGSHEH